MFLGQAWPPATPKARCPLAVSGGVTQLSPHWICMKTATLLTNCFQHC